MRARRPCRPDHFHARPDLALDVPAELHRFWIWFCAKFLARAEPSSPYFSCSCCLSMSWGGRQATGDVFSLPQVCYEPIRWDYTDTYLAPGVESSPRSHC
jgi:hypothetical protein